MCLAEYFKAHLALLIGRWIVQTFHPLQVKPLLQVTNTEEKINQKEAELKQVADRFEKLRFEKEDLEKQHKQVLEEKSALAEQLQAEVELCNEAEEVCTLCIVKSRLTYWCFSGVVDFKN